MSLGILSYGALKLHIFRYCRSRVYGLGSLIEPLPSKGFPSHYPLPITHYPLPASEGVCFIRCVTA